MKLWESHVVTLSFLMSIFIMGVSGTHYSFSVYAQKLKMIMGYSQPDMSLISVFMNLGVYLGPILGILVDLLEPKYCFMIAGMTSLIGYVIGGILVQHVHELKSVSLAVILFFGGFGSGLGYLTSLSVNIRNFCTSKHSGKLIGSLVSLYGFSALIFSSLYKSLNLKVYSYFYLLGITICSVYLFGVVFCRKASTNNQEYSSILVNAERLTMKSGFRRVKSTLLKLVSDRMFWGMFIVFLVGTGCGLLHIGTVGFAIAALNKGEEDKALADRCVFVLSVFNGLGRISIVLSDYIPINRGWFSFFSLIILTIGHVANGVLVSSSHDYLITTCIIGFGYGLMFASTPLLISEVFPKSNYAQIFGWFLIAPALGNAIFMEVSGYLYKAQVPEGLQECVGLNCYMSTYLVAGTASLLTSIVWVIFIKRTPKPY